MAGGEGCPTFGGFYYDIFLEIFLAKKKVLICFCRSSWVVQRTNCTPDMEAIEGSKQEDK